MFKVIRYFTDLQDNGYAYNAGDTFPRNGMTVTADRITELSSSANKQGVPLIEEVRGAEETAAVATAAEKTTDKAAPVEDEPKKRGRKRKE